MRYLELHVTDCLTDTPTLRIEWIHRDHIETIEPWPDDHDPYRAWLELTLTSGQVRYIPIGLQDADGLRDAAARAVQMLLEHGDRPLAAAR